MKSLGHFVRVRVHIHIIHLIYLFSSVTAFSGRLAIRQETCDAFFCAPDLSWDRLIDTLGASFYHLSQPDDRYPQPGTLPPEPETETETETEPTESDINSQVPNSWQDPNDMPTSKTDIELLQLAPDPGSNECQRASPSADYPSDDSIQNGEVNHSFSFN